MTNGLVIRSQGIQTPAQITRIVCMDFYKIGKLYYVKVGIWLICDTCTFIQ